MAGRDGFETMIERINRQRLYRTNEVAVMLHCSVRYVQLLVELGRLDALRVGRFIRIPGEEVVRFIRKYKDWEGGGC
ncbi:MAG: helix-turn-helix domain-containing protein [Fidelibacterota bacterium]|nr:MAG: helix-turn-helix domain-containing protein [Candidatus Neomarinimicrobiota bacterium]